MTPKESRNEPQASWPQPIHSENHHNCWGFSLSLSYTFQALTLHVRETSICPPLLNLDGQHWSAQNPKLVGHWSSWRLPGCLEQKAMQQDAASRSQPFCCPASAKPPIQVYMYQRLTVISHLLERHSRECHMTSVTLHLDPSSW